MNDLHYRLVLDTFADAVVACDATNAIVYVNRAAEDLLGWPAGELVGQSLLVLIPPRLRTAHTSGFTRYLTTRSTKLIGHRIRVPALRRDGAEIDIELALGTVPVEGGELMIASLRDLRERVELERQIAILRYLRAATAAAARLSSRLDLEEVLQTVVGTLAADFDAALARVWLYDEGARRLCLRASAGGAGPTPGLLGEHLDAATSFDKVAEVARTRRAFVKNGLDGDPRFDAAWVAREGIASVAAYPLQRADELFGVLVVYARQALADEVVEALAAFAAIATASLNDVRLFGREQQARARAEEAQRRSAFLAEASRVLASSLDYGTTLDAVARLAVPRLGDWCAVHLTEADGSIRQLTVAHADPARREWARELERRYPPVPGAPYGVPNVIRTGRPEVFTRIPDDVAAAYARDEEHLRLLREWGLTSYLIVPLAARGRTLGTLAFACSEDGRGYEPDDLALAEDLAGRVALAVDNARLYHEAQEAVQARDQFLSIASHELRTPLTPLNLQVQLLLRHARQNTLDRLAPERLLLMFEICDRQVKQTNKLINDLLDVSRITAGRLDLRLEEVDLAAVVRDVATRFGPELSQADCPLELHADAPATGTWDRLRLEQVVTNLLANAVKYGAGKPIAVAVEPGEAGARLTVRDLGIGIAPEHQKRIFERFERAAPGQEFGGLGLGLYIVRQIVEALGGSVVVASQPGAGATFTVDLPCRPPALPR